MRFGLDGAKEVWARLAGVPALDRFTVVVGAPPPWARRGWIAILGLGDSVAASAPTDELRSVVVDALARLDATEATTPDIVTARLPAASTLGPAPLFYLPESFCLEASPAQPDAASSAELDALATAVTADELEESGLTRIDSPVFVSRTADGTVAAACAYQRWPNGVAHLCVLAHPDHRRQGHSTRAATIAVNSAIGEGLLPQWRARPIASQRLAERIGFVRMGTQLAIEPASVGDHAYDASA